MATPERRTAPGTPAAPATAPVASGPVPVVGPLGWLLIMVSGVGLVIATWTVYGTSYETMWAGYRDGIIGTIAVVCALALNTTLPKQPILGVLGISGILLVLFAVFLDNDTVVFVSELTAGVLLLAGTGLYAAGRRD